MANPAKLNQDTDIGDEEGRFLVQFIKARREGRACSLGDNPGYVYCYAVGLIQDGMINNLPDRWREHADELNRLSLVYNYLPDVERDIGIWSSDCYAIVQDYQRAVSSFPAGYFESILRSGDFSWEPYRMWMVDHFLLLKKYACIDVSPEELFVLCRGLGLTDYGLEHIDRVLAVAPEVLAERQMDAGIGFLEKYARPTRGPYNAFRGCYYRYQVSHINRVSFFDANAINFCKVTFKRAENRLREEDGMPLLGTGISYGEAKLLADMRTWLGHEEVRSEVAFDWLGFQHIDVYLPSMQAGIEFQGLQHFRPIDYLGGEEGFQKTLERDARKRALCEQNGLALICVAEGYDLEELKREIRARASGTLTAE